jgi:hypothetical protein
MARVEPKEETAWPGLVGPAAIKAAIESVVPIFINDNNDHYYYKFKIT